MEFLSATSPRDPIVFGDADLIHLPPSFWWKLYRRRVRDGHRKVSLSTKLLSPTKKADTQCQARAKIYNITKYTESDQSSNTSIEEIPNGKLHNSWNLPSST